MLVLTEGEDSADDSRQQTVAKHAAPRWVVRRWWPLSGGRLERLVAGHRAGAVLAASLIVELRGHVFFLFSNRLGCLGSLMVSLVITALLLLLLWR